MDPEKGVKWFFAILFISLILFVAFFFVRQQLDIPRTYVYNDFLISPITNQQLTTYQAEVFINGEGPFKMNARNDPLSVEHIPVDPEVLPYLLNKDAIRAAIDPNDPRLMGATTVAALEFNNVMEGFFQIPVSASVTAPHDDFPLVSCEDSTETDGVVIFELAESTQVVYEGCVRVQGVTEFDLIEASNRIGYGLVGIIP